MRRFELRQTSPSGSHVRVVGQGVVFASGGAVVQYTTSKTGSFHIHPDFNAVMAASKAFANIEHFFID